ncbi:hypothetical protein FACS189496_5440 [Bacilli bacterium]|nr:hypothetical protein FACS189496_5440 [Bacilli bacterium]
MKIFWVIFSMGAFEKSKGVSNGVTSGKNIRFIWNNLWYKQENIYRLSAYIS